MWLRRHQGHAPARRVDINQAIPGVALAAGLHTANGNTIFTTRTTRASTPCARILASTPSTPSNRHSIPTTTRSRSARVKSFRSAGVLGVAYTYSKYSPITAPTVPTLRRTAITGTRANTVRHPVDRKQIFSLNYVYTAADFCGGHSMADQVAGGLAVLRHCLRLTPACLPP